MIEVEARAHVARPPDEVFAYLADASNNPTWQKGMRSARWTSPAPIGLGSTYEQEAVMLGKRILSSFVVTAHEPGRSITIATTASTFPIEVTRRVEPDGSGGSLVSATIRGDASGVFRLAEPLMKRLVHLSVTADYRRLEQVLGRA